jgi:hypothetical protein
MKYIKGLHDEDNGTSSGHLQTEIKVLMEA